MIEPLDWDTNFFGYAIGQSAISGDDKKSIVALLKEAGKFKLVYIDSDKEMIPAIDRFKFVSTKAKLSKEVVSMEDLGDLNLGEYDGGDPGQLKKLALQSGIYSRFKMDSHFINNEFEKLYLKWIANSIKKNVADAVIVYKDGKDYRAFLTLKYKKDVAEIGLIAVDEQSRGKGVGLALLSYVNNLAMKMGCKKIEVTTQFENQPAMKLYEKAGYKVLSKKYIYHLWN
ncbi:MAG: GNAT family N-acetyltransferase [Ferruginibacter sp.]